MLDIKGGNGWVHTGSILLSLLDQVSLQIHESVQSFVLLDFEDHQVGLLLGGAKFNRKFSRVITGLNPQLIELALLDVKCRGHLLQLRVKLSIVGANTL